MYTKFRKKSKKKERTCSIKARKDKGMNYLGMRRIYKHMLTLKRKEKKEEKKNTKRKRRNQRRKGSWKRKDPFKD